MLCRPFYGHGEGKPGRQFSNLYKAEVLIDTGQSIPGIEETFLMFPDGEVRFPSTENAFQCAKAAEQIHDLFVRRLSPYEAAFAGQGRLKMSSKQRRLYEEELGGTAVSIASSSGKVAYSFSEDLRYPRRATWDQIKTGVMDISLKAKFSQHPELWSEHLSPEGPATFFIEHTFNDKQWGDDWDGAGTNYLGKLLTVLLWELQSGDSIDRTSRDFQRWLLLANRQIASGYYAALPDRDAALAMRPPPVKTPRKKKPVKPRPPALVVEGATIDGNWILEHFEMKQGGPWLGKLLVELKSLHEEGKLETLRDVIDHLSSRSPRS